MSNNNPFDMSQWLSQMNVPGIDVQAMLEASRKDWEALQQAGELVNSGWQTLAQRQQELMQKAIAQWQSEFTASLTRSPEQNAAKMQENIKASLASMTELAEIMRQSQTEAADVLQQRFEENMRRLSSGAASPAAKKPAAKKKAPAKKRTNK